MARENSTTVTIEQQLHPYADIVGVNDKKTYKEKIRFLRSIFESYKSIIWAEGIQIKKQDELTNLKTWIKVANEELTQKM